MHVTRIQKGTSEEDDSRRSEKDKAGKVEERARKIRTRTRLGEIAKKCHIDKDRKWTSGRREKTASLSGRSAAVDIRGDTQRTGKAAMGGGVSRR